MNLEKEIFVSKGTTYYPFREIIEKIGGEVKWAPSINAAVAEYGGNRIEFEFNSNRYRVNGEIKYLPKGQKTLLRDDSITYIPVRYAMEGLGLSVDWDQKTYSILLNNYLEEVNNIDEDNIDIDDTIIDEDENLIEDKDNIIKEDENTGINLKSES